MLKLNKFRESVRGQAGQAIMQAVVGAVITGMVALTSISLVNQQKKDANVSRIKSRAREIESRLQSYIENDIAWKATVADTTNNASMSCLRSGSPADCKDQTGSASLTRFYLWGENSTGSFVYTGIDPAGLKLDGSTCTPWGASTNLCPIKVAMCWQAVDVRSPPPASIAGDGPDGSACGRDTDSSQIDCTTANGSQDCKVRIRATFEYKEAGQGLFFGTRLNSQNYAVNFTREGSSKAQYVHVIDRKSLGTPGGACAVGTWTNPRVFNTLVADTGGNLVGFTNGTDQNSITLKSGTYQCEVSAPSGTTAEHQARLVVGVTPAVTGTTGYYYSTANISGSFTITSNTAIQVQHLFKATASPATDCMGKATNLGAAEVYTSLKCLKITN